MEPKREPKIMKNQLKGVTKIEGTKNNEMEFQARGTLNLINSQSKLRHSAGKLNLKKT